jgi:hypothetical protein
MFTKSIRSGLALLGATAAITLGASTANALSLLAPPNVDPPCYSHYNPSSDTFEWTCGLGA